MGLGPSMNLQNKNRKVYMLFNLIPSRWVTGGPWYGTDQVYGAEFVDVVKQQCLQFITKRQDSETCFCAYVTFFSHS